MTPAGSAGRAVSTWRRTVRLRDAEARLVAEVVDDEVSVLEGRRVAARFREVEVELKEGEKMSLLGAGVTLDAEGTADFAPAGTPRILTQEIGDLLLGGERRRSF